MQYFFSELPSLCLCIWIGESLIFTCLQLNSHMQIRCIPSLVGLFFPPPLTIPIISINVLSSDTVSPQYFLHIMFGTTQDLAFLVLLHPETIGAQWPIRGGGPIYGINTNVIFTRKQKYLCDLINYDIYFVVTI